MLILFDLHVAEQFHHCDYGESGEEQAADDEADADEPVGAYFAREQDEIDREHVEAAKSEGCVVNAAGPFEELLRVPAGERREAEHRVTANGAEVENADAVRFPAADEWDGGPTQVDPAAQGGVDRADRGWREYEKSAEQREPPEVVAKARTGGV